MSTREADPIIRNTTLPQYCSSCFNQDSEKRHIDFDASVDRGWYGKDPGTHIAMDDLILCETCIGEAARQLGYVTGSTLMEENKALKTKLDLEEKLRKQAQNYADTMEEALSKRPEKVQIDHRKRPRQLRTQED